MLLGAPPVVHVGNERWTGERRARVWASRLRLTWRDRGRTAAEVERAALLALALARVAVHGRGPAAGWRSLAGAMVGPLGAVVSREGPGGRSGETLRRG